MQKSPIVSHIRAKTFTHWPSSIFLSVAHVQDICGLTFVSKYKLLQNSPHKILIYYKVVTSYVDNNQLFKLQNRTARMIFDLPT